MDGAEDVDEEGRGKGGKVCSLSQFFTNSSFWELNFNVV